MTRVWIAFAAGLVLSPLGLLVSHRLVAQVPVGSTSATMAGMADQDHMAMAQGQTAPTFTAPKNDQIPPADPNVDDALKNSPRHGEWVDVKMPDGPALKSYLVYPVRTGKAGVVIVIHEIFGMTPWVQGVADQLAKDGFIAIAPDLLSGKGPDGGGTSSLPDRNAVNQAIGTLTPADRAQRLDAVMAYGKTIPSSNGTTGVVGFCWGGGSSLLYAMAQPSLKAAVMYYGPAPVITGTQTPDLSGLPKIQAPILAFYPSTDTHTLPTAEPIAGEMKKLGKSFEYHVYDGAAHGFMHLRTAADYKAATESWPLAVAFFNKQLK
jgi:carboxymethylenebutenolidase